MSAIEDFLRVAETYRRATGLVESTVSFHAFNEGMKIQNLREGADILSRRLEEGMLRLFERWPQGAAWPADIPVPKRPKRGSRRAAA